MKFVGVREDQFPGIESDGPASGRPNDAVVTDVNGDTVVSVEILDHHPDGIEPIGPLPPHPYPDGDGRGITRILGNAVPPLPPCPAITLAHYRGPLSEPAARADRISA